MSDDPVTAYARDVVAGEILAGQPVRATCKRHLADLKSGKKRGLTWDWPAAERALAFFPAVLRFHDGKMAGLPFELLDWQVFVIGSLFGWKLKGGARRFRKAYIETAKGPLALDTPIATPSGWSTMGDLQPGDQVFDEHGKVCNVTAISETFSGRPCYRMTFSDGDSIVADHEHRWQVTGLRSHGKPGPKPPGEPRKGQPCIRTTADIAATYLMPATTSLHPQALFNYRVAIAGALDLPDIDLPVPPYTLGVWLGDGDSDCARITSHNDDVELREAVGSEGISVGPESGKKGNAARYRIGGVTGCGRGTSASLQSKLRKMGMLGNKRVPKWYLRAGTAQRLALLQGLLDTDGSISKHGDVEFSTKWEHLADDVAELVRSLGLKASVTCNDSTLNGRVVGKRYRLKFRAYADLPVFKLSRKLSRQIARPSTRPLSEGRMIVGCDKVESVPVKCITVDSPSHLFLAGRSMIPTHNSGKSPLCAGIGLYCLAADGEAGAEVYAAAVSKDQAGILFRDAEQMAKASPALDKRLTFTRGNIAFMPTGSFFRPVSSEGRSLDGKRVHCALLDEVHEHRTNIVVEKMIAGTKARQNALIVEITNSGFDRNSVCWSHHDYSIKVANGELQDDEWFSFVCQQDPGDWEPGDDFPREDTWAKSNPSLEQTPGLRYLRGEVQQARGMPSKVNLVKRLNFCIWTEADERWLDYEAWAGCAPAARYEELRGRACYGGLDLSSTVDLTSLVLVFPDDEGGYDALPFFWLPDDGLHEKAHKDKVPYTTWRDQGFLETTPGRSIDKWFVARRLAMLAQDFDIRAVAFDRWRIEDFKRQLEDEDCGVLLEAWGQGFKDMAVAVDSIETLIREKRFRHGNHPVLTWCASNAVTVADPAGNRKWAKDKAVARIDGIVAASMAVGIAHRQIGDAGPSVYDSRGFLSF